MLDWQAEYLAGGAPPPAHPSLHVTLPAAPGGVGAAAASGASAPLAPALSVASSTSSLGLDLPPAAAPVFPGYAALYAPSGPFSYDDWLLAESSELCWDVSPPPSPGAGPAGS